MVVGSCGVDLTFGNNTINHSETLAYKEYLNKVKNLSFNNGFTDVVGATKTDKTDSQASVVGGTATIWGGEYFNNNGDASAFKQHVFGETNSFIYSANIKITKTT